MKVSKSQYIYYWLSLFVIIALFFIMFGLHPDLCDDLRFKAPMAGFIENPTFSNFCSCWANSVVDCLRIDNGRIAQLFASVIVTLPKWVMAAILSVSVAGCIFFSAMIAGVWGKHHLLYGILVSVWIFIMPWSDFMFGLMFASNYIPTGALMLLTLWMFLRLRLKVWSSVILGLLVGCSHELYCAAMIALAVSLVICYKEYRNCQSYLLLASLVVSLVYLYCVPGTGVRSGMLNVFGGFSNLLSSAYLGVLLYVYVILFVVVCIDKRWRSDLNMRIQVVCMAGAFTGWLIWRLFMGGQRLLWCLDIFSIIGIVSLLVAWPYKKIRYSISKCLSVSVMVICILHLVLCLPWFMRMHREVEEVQSMRSDTDDYVFYDLTKPIDAPWYILGKPNFNIYNSSWYSLDYVVPKILKSFNASKGKNIGVGTDIFMYEDYLVVPCIGQKNNASVVISADYDGLIIVVDAAVRKFSADDGLDYQYIVPIYTPLRTVGRELVSVKLI